MLRAPGAPSCWGLLGDYAAQKSALLNRGTRGPACLPTDSFSWLFEGCFRSITSPHFQLCSQQEQCAQAASQVFPALCLQRDELSVERTWQGTGRLQTVSVCEDHGRKLPQPSDTGNSVCVCMCVCVCDLQALILINHHVCFSVLAIGKLRNNV